MPIRVRNKINNADTFFGPHSTDTSQFGPPTAGEATVWLPNTVDVINATQAVLTPMGAGDSRTLTFRNGSTQTGSSLVLAEPNAHVRGLINGTLQAGLTTSQLDGNIGRQVNGGTPPFEDSRIAFFYRDTVDENVVWLSFGNPTGNQTVTGTPEYYGIDQSLTTTVETVARVIVPGNVHLRSLYCRYSGTALTEHTLSAMIDGVATVIGVLVGGAVPALFTFTPNLAIPELSELSFRVVRTTGGGSNMVLLALCAFTLDEP